MRVTVCTWDPVHTLNRAEAQQAAVADGTIMKLVTEFGEGTDGLRSAFVRNGLSTYNTSLRGEKHCPECGSMMDEVMSANGIEDKLEAIRDVAQDFDKALTRTRRAR